MIMRTCASKLNSSQRAFQFHSIQRRDQLQRNPHACHTLVMKVIQLNGIFINIIIIIIIINNRW